MTKGSRKTGLTTELLAISHLNRDELIEQWKSIYGRPPPKGFGRRLFELAVAYHLQVATKGGLKPAIVKRLQAYAERDAENRSPKSGSKNQNTVSVGSRLVREWHGNTYVVDVGDTGFLFKGQTFKSLSKVAKEITGAHWSGRRFFGL
jgi:hypothetical protein